MCYQGLSDWLTSIYIERERKKKRVREREKKREREREKESENSLLGNEKQQKQQQKQLCGRQHEKKKWEDKWNLYFVFMMNLFFSWSS